MRPLPLPPSLTKDTQKQRPSWASMLKQHDRVKQHNYEESGKKWRNDNDVRVVWTVVSWTLLVGPTVRSKKQNSQLTGWNVYWNSPPAMSGRIRIYLQRQNKGDELSVSDGHSWYLSRINNVCAAAVTVNHQGGRWLMVPAFIYSQDKDGGPVGRLLIPAELPPGGTFKQRLSHNKWEETCQTSSRRCW